MKETSMSHPIESLRYVKCYSSSSPRPIQSLSNSVAVKRSTVDQEDAKSHWKSDKRPHLSKWSTILLLTSFSNIILTTEKKTNRPLAIYLFPKIWNTWTTWDLPTVRKTRFLKTHTEKFRFTILQNYHCNRIRYNLYKAVC